MSDNQEHTHHRGSASGHLPVIVMVFVVAAVFVCSLMAYKVNATEYAIVLRFGKPVDGRLGTPGLHFKLPWETVWRADRRIHCFEGTKGVLEEVFTKDGKNVIVTAYMGWCVGARAADQRLFLNTIGTASKEKIVERAEEELTSLLRSFKNAVIGQYEFSDMINIVPEAVRIGEIEEQMRTLLTAEAKKLYGIDVQFVGIKHIGFPESVTTKVIARMQAERNTLVEETLSAGDAEAVRVRAEGDRQRQVLLAEAESKAKVIRAQGDADAAAFYSEFNKQPELAKFLLDLEALRKVFQSESTLIFDTKTAPFHLFNPDATNLKLKQ